jgi:hypothetical protein
MQSFVMLVWLQRNRDWSVETMQLTFRAQVVQKVDRQLAGIMQYQ